MRPAVLASAPALLAARAAAPPEGRPDPLQAILDGARRSAIDDSTRGATLLQLVSAARFRTAGVAPEQPPGAPGDAAWEPLPPCPPARQVGENWTTAIEAHHYRRHAHWAEQQDFCGSSLGLWTSGCGVMCPLRAAVIGTFAGLAPGQLVLDVGSACGHFARWFHDWFGARTLGVDFVESAVLHARRDVGSHAPARFCHHDVAAGLRWVPARSADLATAVSVLHYLRSDSERHEAGAEPSPADGVREVARTPCEGLRRTARTQCRAARDMFRSVRVGGCVWIAHNGSYKGKWDPKRVWGEGYWRCCFMEEVRRGEASLQEVPEIDVFLNDAAWDPTYSVVIRRLK